jgi:uncharacterized membrane protein
LPGSTTSYASGISNSGRIVGTSYEHPTLGARATSRDPATPIEAMPNRSFAIDVSATGVVVGTTFDEAFNSDGPVVWRGEQRTSLPILPDAAYATPVRSR